MVFATTVTGNSTITHRNSTLTPNIRDLLGIFLFKSKFDESDIKYLAHFNILFHFYNPRKRQKTFGFQTFSAGAEMEHWTKMG